MRDAAQQRRSDDAEPAPAAHDQPRVELVCDLDDRPSWAFGGPLDPRGRFEPVVSRKPLAVLGRLTGEQLLLSIDSVLVTEVGTTESPGSRQQHRGGLPDGQYAGWGGMHDELGGCGHRGSRSRRPVVAEQHRSGHEVS